MEFETISKKELAALVVGGGVSTPKTPSLNKLIPGGCPCGGYHD
jgi:hypothetical protein